MPAPSICVFCSASEDIDPRYLDLAAAVGRAIAARGWTLVSGGGSISMMGALARAARDAGAHTIGVIPEALLAREVADHDADELVVTRDMRQRKGVMDERSDAFLALPGGIGTLEELLEAWTALTLGMHAKPVIVLDPWGDFALLSDLIDGLVDSGFVRRAAATQLQWTRDMTQALDLIAGAQRSVPAVVDDRRHAAELLESDEG